MPESADAYNERVTAAEEYAQAMAAERAAWEAVRDKLPGTPTYSPELWKKWREAATRSDTVRREVIAALGRTLP
jgi:CelD/BcsL family acetyltransferase involved in cellulose biosynthesis